MAAGWALGLSALGLGLNFFGGREQDRRMREMAEAQYQQDLLNYEFSWEEAKDAHTFRLEDIEIAQWNLAQQKKFEEETALREWVENDQQRLFDYNNQVDAYNASIEAYETQLDFNQIADQLATNSARLAYQDDLIRIGFQLEDVTTKTEAQIQGIGVNRLSLVAKRNAALRENKINKNTLKQDLAARKAKYAQDLQNKQLEALAAEGKIKALGQSGRSARKSIAAALSNSQRLQYAIADAMTRDRVKVGLNLEALNAKLAAMGTDLDLQDHKQYLDLFNTRVQLDQNERQINEQLISGNIAFEANKQKQKLDKYGADLRAREMISATPILQPEAPRPIERPELQIQTPRAPRPGPRPRKYVAAQGHGLAALGSGMSSLATAVAAFD